MATKVPDLRTCVNTMQCNVDCVAVNRDITCIYRRAVDYGRMPLLNPPRTLSGFSPDRMRVALCTLAEYAMYPPITPSP